MQETRVWSPGEGNDNALQYSCLENSTGYCPWGRKELDTTERFHFHFQDREEASPSWPRKKKTGTLRLPHVMSDAKEKGRQGSSLLFFKVFFLMWTIFLKSLLNFLQYCFCLMFQFFGQEACGILAPSPGIEPISPALEDEVLTTGAPASPRTHVFQSWWPRSTKARVDQPSHPASSPVLLTFPSLL